MTPARPISGPHTRSTASVPAMMGHTLAALLPATLFGLYQFGWPAVFLLGVTLLAALASEALSLRLSGLPVWPYLSDGSALLTGWLLALSLPPWAPWWIGVLGAAFAIVVGKQIFGGLGQNVFNPAMLARVALLVSFPVQMTTWPPPHAAMPGSAEGWLGGLAVTGGGVSLDGVSEATPLGAVQEAVGQGEGLPAAMPEGHSLLGGLLGNMPGSLGETSALLLLLGGAWLLFRRIIPWTTPLALLGTVAILTGLLHAANPAHFAGPAFHLSSGGVMLAAFWIATDPVTSPTTRHGQILFGVGCGALTVVIRNWGSYPEGVAFAILLMNALTPIIDHYIRPRALGRDRRGTALDPPEDTREILK